MAGAGGAMAGVGGGAGGVAGTNGAPSPAGGAGGGVEAGPADADAEGISADAGADKAVTPPGTCPLLAPTLPTFYPNDATSPCPTERLMANPGMACDPSLIQAVQCVYPSPTDPTAESICTCNQTSSDSTIPNGWYCWDEICRREGDACLVDWVSAPRENEIQLSSFCNERQPIPCDAESTDTDQLALDGSLGNILMDCGLNPCGMSAGLSVFLEAGCVQSFALAPGWVGSDYSTAPWLVQCVTQKLESVNFSCAKNLACGRARLPYLLCPP